MKAKVTILIAVRMKSTRLPKKALRIIENQTLIEHLIDRMRCCKRVDEVVLCTSTHPDDEQLIGYAEKKGIEWFRGSEDDVMDRFIKAGDQIGANVVVRVTGDNIFSSPEYIDYAIEQHFANEVEYTTTEELPRGTKGEVINLDTLKRVHRLAEDTSKTEYMTWYLDQPQHVKLQKLAAPPGLYGPKIRLTCDTPEDLSLIERLFAALYQPGKSIPLRDVIAYLQEHPDLLQLNREIAPKKVEVNTRLRKE